tara:strand:- start:116 stop:589 length:474 start_codon:yes stop_codon:yes gene_type:complete
MKHQPCRIGLPSHDVENFKYIWDSSSSFGGVGLPHSAPPHIVIYPGSGSKVHGRYFVIMLTEMRPFMRPLIGDHKLPFQPEYIDVLYDYLTRNGITENIQIIGTQKDFLAIKIWPPGKPETHRDRNRVEDLLPLKKLGYSISFHEINERKGNPSYEL